MYILSVTQFLKIKIKLNKIYKILLKLSNKKVYNLIKNMTKYLTRPFAKKIYKYTDDK